MGTEIEEIIASWPAPARAAPVRRAWHALRGEPRRLRRRARADGDGAHVAETASSSVRGPDAGHGRNPRPVLAMLRAPQIRHPTDLDGDSSRRVSRTRIARECRLPGAAKERTAAAAAASSRDFLSVPGDPGISRQVLELSRRSRCAAEALARRRVVRWSARPRRRVCVTRVLPRRSARTRRGPAEGDASCPGDSSLLPMRRGHDLRTDHGRRGSLD